jgi:hypothetical protein
MADEFITVDMTTDQTTLADEAIARLQAQWGDWEPNDGDLEVVQIEALALMAADVAETAVRVPPTIFQIVGVELHGVLMDEGLESTGTVTFTLTDTDPHTIPEGTEVAIDGYAFLVDSDVTNSGDTTVPGVPVTCAIVGTEADALPGDSVELLSSLAFVADVTLDAPTDGGVDPETPEAYRTKLSRELELQAKTLVTSRDYELWALTEQGIGRATAVKNDTTRAITVVVADDIGETVPTPTKTSLAADYSGLRQTTWTVSVADATYTTVDLAYSIHLYPGFDPADVTARVTAMLQDLLSPAGWGIPKTEDTGWVADNVVRKNKLIDLIGDVSGVDYVSTLTITGADGAGNVTLPGTIGLPRPGSITGSVV